MDTHDEFELTDSERAAFLALPRALAPDPAVEDRVVHALRVEEAFTRRRWYRRAIPVPLAAAAGFVLFAAGAAAGATLLPLMPHTESSAAPSPSPNVRTIAAPADGKLVGWL